MTTPYDDAQTGSGKSTSHGRCTSVSVFAECTLVARLHPSIPVWSFPNRSQCRLLWRWWSNLFFCVDGGDDRRPSHSLIMCVVASMMGVIQFKQINKQFRNGSLWSAMTASRSGWILWQVWTLKNSWLIFLRFSGFVSQPMFRFTCCWILKINL